MNRNLGIIIAIVIIAVGGLFFYNSQLIRQTKPSVPAIVEAPTPTLKELTVVLSEQNNSNEVGTATLKEVGGKVMATLAITGAPKNVAQPAHIHVGSCPTPGVVKYPLESLVDGRSETTLDVTLKMLEKELPLVVNVHKSAQEAKVYVSCGDLEF